MDNQEKKNQPPKENDIDLGSLLASTRRGFRSMARSLGTGGSALGIGLLNIVVFIKKRFLWFMLAGAAGIGWGIYTESDRTIIYNSEMSARFNFGSTLTLYNSIDYLNALISEGDRDQLAKLLGISVEDARDLAGFSAEPISDELTTSELYKRHFMIFDRTNFVRTDTFWTRILPYDKFKSSLTKFDIPTQRITASSTRNKIFGKLQAGFVQLITSNEILKKNFDASTQLQMQEKQIILSSILGLDTLRTVYNERLRQFPNAGTSQATSINLMERAVIPASPELQLYDKVMVFKDELRAITNFSINNSELVQVYAPFNPVGKKQDHFRKNVIYTTVAALIMMLVILVAIEGFKFINAYEKSSKSKPAP
jgi:hypothetical protein